MELTVELAKWFDGKKIEIDGIVYTFDLSGVKVNGRLEMGTLTIDATQDGEWLHEHSMVYGVGSEIYGEPWMPATQ